MPQKAETKFRIRVMASLASLPNSFFESIQQKAINGTPDILGVVNGFFVAIELKATPKSKVSELQSYKLSQIIKAGGIAMLVHPGNWAETFESLKRISGATELNPIHNFFKGAKK